MPTYLRIPSNKQVYKEPLVSNKDNENDVDIILRRASRIVFILCTAALVIVHIAALILR